MFKNRQKAKHLKKSLLRFFYGVVCLIFTAVCILPQPTYGADIPIYELNESGEKQLQLEQEEFELNTNPLVITVLSVTVNSLLISLEFRFSSEFSGDVPNPPPEVKR